MVVVLVVVVLVVMVVCPCVPHLVSCIPSPCPDKCRIQVSIDRQSRWSHNFHLNYIKHESMNKN